MRLPVVIILTAVAFMFTACHEQSDSVSSAKILKDLSYGPDSLNGLDLYLPEGRTPATPLVIFIHGGAWVHGDKSGFSRYAEEIYENKWSVANINYRLLNGYVNYKSILSDVKQAIDFLSEHSDEYGISTRKLALIGHSAGGHIALLYAHHMDPSKRVSLVVSYAGPTNINDPKLKLYADSVWDMPFLYPLLLGGPFSLNSKAAIDCSPVYHVSAVPTILIHGTDDPIVPYSQALQLNDSLASKNGKHLLISVPKGNHNLHNVLSDSINRTLKKWITDQ